MNKQTRQIVSDAVADAEPYSEGLQGHWQSARQGLPAKLLRQLLHHLLICHLLCM